MPVKQPFAKLWKSGTDWLQKPIRALRFARNLLKEGGHSIETPFTYQGNAFVLRTVIGFGDMLNFIPDPVQEWNDSTINADWHNYYKEQVALHFNKTTAFLNAFEKQTIFWENSLKGIVGVANVYPLYQAFLMEEWLLLLSPVASAVYLYFLGKATAQKLVVGLWQIAKRLFTVRGK
jgi:hypothetical protein